MSGQHKGRLRGPVTIRLMFFDVEQIVLTGGLLAIAFIVFAESGLFFGFFLPGDTLLLTAGFLAAQGHLPIVPLIAIIVVSAILGDNVGYQTGRRFGPSVFKRKDGIFFRQEYLLKANEFYKKHGGKTIILARFFPAVRTFAPIVAGAGKMDWRYFAAFNVVGALLWGLGITLLGYFIGTRLPNIDQYLILGIIIVAHLFLLGILIKIFKNPDVRHQLKKNLREEWNHFFGKKP